MGLYILISVLILITCILIILVVLVQNSKGGGLASNFAGSNQYMGVRKTADFLEKATWTLAIALLFFSLVSIFVIPRGEVIQVNASELQDKVEDVQIPNALQDYQAPPPQEQENAGGN